MTCIPLYPVRYLIAHRALLLALPLLTILTLPLSSQNRDLRAGRLVLDDNGSDGDGMHTVLLTGPTLSTNRTILLPDADGTVMLQPSGGFSSGDILFGGFGGITFTSLISIDSATGTLVAEQLSDGVAELSEGAFTGLQRIEGLEEVIAPVGENLYLTSYGSVIVNIDDDNDGSGSSFSVEANGSPDDLFSVTETGLTTVRSTSSSGGLRVENGAASSTAAIVEFGDGDSTRMVLRRNGDLGLGDATPDARLDVESGNPAAPAVAVTHSSSDGIALALLDGRLLLSTGSGTDATIPGDVVIWTVEDDGICGTEVTVGLPSGEEGAILFVLWQEYDPGTVGPFSAASGDRLTLVCTGGEWYEF